MKRENQTITVRLPDDLLARLDGHVERIRGVRNKEILKAIQDHLDAQEGPGIEYSKSCARANDKRSQSIP